MREELLLEIATIVEAAGSAFAQPTEFIYTDGKQADDAPVRVSAARDSVARDDARLAQSIADTRADNKAIQR